MLKLLRISFFGMFVFNIAFEGMRSTGYEISRDEVFIHNREYSSSTIQKYALT